MDRQIFEKEMCKAKVFRGAGDQPHYWSGYQQGLRRRYHGEKFGTDNEHELSMSLAGDDTQDRADRSCGYRDGFNYGSSGGSKV